VTTQAARFPNGVEQRAAVELRASGRRLVGYAAVFNSPAQIGAFRETIKPGCFRASLAASRDVLALVDHDATKVLARVSAGNLTLTEDERGLAFAIDLPSTTLANDTLAMVESRTAGGMSFGFRVAPGGDAWPAPDRRELRAVDLVEISVVSAWVAYDATSVSARFRAASVDPARVRRIFLDTL
jgi:uncharacterized protein